MSGIINTQNYFHDVKRGSIFYVMPSPNRKETGSEQEVPEKGRPALVISNDEGNKNSDMCIVAYMTLQDKPELPTHVHIDKGDFKGSTILFEQIYAVSQERLGKWKCELDSDNMKRVDKAIAVSLDIKLKAKDCEKEIELLKQCIVEKDAKIAELESTVKRLNAENATLINAINNSGDKEVTKLQAQLDLYKSLYQDLLRQSLK